MDETVTSVRPAGPLESDRPDRLKMEHETRETSEQAGNRNMTKRDSNGCFKKGSSGNPGGRPRSSEEFRTLAQSHTNQALSALVGILTKGTNMEKIQAARILIERAYGKSQTLEEENSKKNPMFGLF
jgi:hypothetical protein